MPQAAADLTMTAEGARSSMTDPVEHAATVVKEEREVAESLARAEASPRVKAEASGNEGAEANAASPPSFPYPRLNEGSFGHPELCQRPCLFFARGECANSAGCNYCHLDHAKRPVNPDKQNRQLLSNLAFPELLATILPAIREKMQGLGLGGTEGDRKLSALAERLAVGDYAAWTSAVQQFPGRKGKQLELILRAMTLRSLIHLLVRAAPTSCQSTQLQEFADSLRNVLARRGSS